MVVRALDPSIQKPAGHDLFNLADDEVDFAVFKCHVDVLGWVLMNVPQYVALECKAKTPNAVSPLKVIEELLRKLGGAISEQPLALPPEEV